MNPYFPNAPPLKWLVIGLVLGGLLASVCLPYLLLQRVLK